MANELVHGTVGVSMTQAEFEAVGLHVCNSQATGDLIYASSATQLTRLAAGAQNTILVMGASIPAWSATLSGLTFVAPALGAATATSINGLIITTTAGTLTIANNASAALVTSGNYSITLTATAATNVTLPTTGTLSTLAGTEELDAKTLDSSVGKGTWTASGTWTLPAITLGGTLSTGGQTISNASGNIAFSSGTDGSGAGITNTAGQIGIYLYGQNNVATQRPARIHFYGKDNTSAVTEYGAFSVEITDATDTSEDGRFEWELIEAGTTNQAMLLASTGVLSVDLAGGGAAAQVDLFDEYDDALVLQKGIQLNNREMLANMGVLTRKNTGSGYMMNLQPMVRLLAGGIYQTRQKFDEKIAELEARLAEAGI